MTRHSTAQSFLRRGAALCLMAGLLAATPGLAAAAGSPLGEFDPGTYPTGLAYGPDESVWATVTGPAGIAWLGVTSAGVQPLADPDARPLDIIVGPDRALWFSLERGDAIGRLEPGGEVTTYPLSENASPAAVVLGQDRAIWFTEYEANRIGRLTADGDLTEYDLPRAGSKPLGMVSAPDGGLWFVEWGGYRLGRISLKGEIQEYDIPNPPARPVDLVYGPDRALWILFNSGRTIQRFDPQAEQFTAFTLETANTSLADLTIGPDGRLWFVGTHTSGSFAVVDGAPSALAETDLDAPVYSYQGRSQIIAGPDNNLFYTTANAGAVFETRLDGEPALRDLQLFITYQPPLVLAGGRTWIDAEIVNWSSAPASNVELRLKLDEGLQVQSAELAGGSCAAEGDEVVCTLPSVDAGGVVPARFELAARRVLSADVLQRELSLAVRSAEADYQPANNRVVLPARVQAVAEYFNDFSSGAEENWSHPVTGTPVPGLDVLGPFANDQVSFTWPDLPPHDRVKICFDLYVLGPWAGNRYLDTQSGSPIGPDLWSSYLDDRQLELTTFSNLAGHQQAFPGQYTQSLYPAQFGAAETGEFDGDPSVTDARYRFCSIYPHDRLSMKLLLMGLNLAPEAGEQWAVDNVRIQIFYQDAFNWLYMPALAK